MYAFLKFFLLCLVSLSVVNVYAGPVFQQFPQKPHTQQELQLQHLYEKILEKIVISDPDYKKYLDTAAIGAYSNPHLSDELAKILLSGTGYGKEELQAQLKIVLGVYVLMGQHSDEAIYRNRHAIKRVLLESRRLLNSKEIKAYEALKRRNKLSFSNRVNQAENLVSELSTAFAKQGCLDSLSDL